MEKNKIDCHPVQNICTDENSKLLHMRLNLSSIEERLDTASLCPMFSFWYEIQDTLRVASEEIKSLKQEIKLLKEKLNDQENL
jgi:hypothetical protein